MQLPPRICIDANCLIAGIASPSGASARIVRNVAAGRLRLVVSADLVAEYVAIAHRPSVQRLFNRHGVATSEYLDVLNELCRAAEWVVPAGTAPECRDENDRKYLHCAGTAGVDFLVSRDDDLLVLEQVESIPIVDPGTLLKLVREAGIRLDP